MPSPRLIAISRIRDEIDIVEPFIRHHTQYFDLVIALDDGSRDGTYETLLALRDEGLPLVVMSEPSVGNNHWRSTNALMALAFDKHQADWVAPLDVDEFIEPPAGLSVADILRDRAPRLLAYGWSNFVWRPDLDRSAEINPVAKLTLRMPEREDHQKVVVPAALWRGHSADLWEGGHGLNLDGQGVYCEPFTGVSLCHYPVRSVAQFISKVAIATLQYDSSGRRGEGAGFHYREPFRQLCEEPEGLAGSLERLSSHYSAQPTLVINDNPEHAPLRYVGGALTYTRPHVDYLANILTCAHAIAIELGLQRQGVHALRRELVAVTPDLEDKSDSDRVKALDAKVRHAEGVAVQTTLRLNAIDQEAARLVAANDRLSAHLTVALDANRDLSSKAEGLDDRITELEREAAAAKQALYAAQASNHAFLASRSWRVTAPMRRAHLWLQNKRQN